MISWLCINKNIMTTKELGLVQKLIIATIGEITLEGEKSDYWKKVSDETMQELAGLAQED